MDKKENLLSQDKFSADSSIAESYRFLTGHMPHFIQLIRWPLLIWVLARLGEQVLSREYNIQLQSIYFLNLVTAAFALVWYRQYLLGVEYAGYRQLLKSGFDGSFFSAGRFFRALARIVVISMALLVPTLIISITMMIYYHGQGIDFSDQLIRDLAVKSTFVVMLAFSPLLARLSLYTAGLALGRRSLGFRDVWAKTRGYTVTLWWLTIRGFLPLSIYSYVLTFLFEKIIDQMSVNYILSTILIETLAGFMTFLMLAILVAANAEAFRILIGVRQGDTPHLPDSSLAKTGEEENNDDCRRKISSSQMSPSTK